MSDSGLARWFRWKLRQYGLARWQEAFSAHNISMRFAALLLLVVANVALRQFCIAQVKLHSFELKVN